MSFGFEGYALTPGHHDEFFTQEGQITWGRWDQQKISQALLDKDTVDSGNSTTTLIRPGLALGVLSSGQLTHWNPYSDDTTASQGSSQFVGFFQENLDLGYLGGTKERLIYCLVGGNIRADAIVIPGQASAGIVGDDYEFLLREAAANSFLFDDDLNRSQGWKVKDKSASYAAVVGDNKTHFTNRGATGTITITLPAPQAGMQFKVSQIASQAITLEGPATGEYYIGGVTVDNDTLLAVNDETDITITALRTGASTYQYVLTPEPA